MPESAVNAHGASRDSLLEVFWTKVPGTVTLVRTGCPRVHANVPVRISGPSNAPVKIRTNDLSLGGLQIRCSRAMADRLCPDPGAVLAGETGAPTNALTLLLSIDGQTSRVNAHGRVAHLTLLPDSGGTREVAVGFTFLEFEEGSREALMRFIEYHMCPAGV